MHSAHEEHQGQNDILSAHMVDIHVTTMSGAEILLNRPIRSEDVVDDLRERIAAALGIHPGQTVILHGDAELQDGQALKDVLHGQTATFCVSQLPCRTRPHEYESNIDRAATAFVEVSRLQYPQWHHLDFPDDAEKSPHGGFCHEPHLGEPAPWEGNEAVGQAHFPEPKGININMMPFVMGDAESIPEEYRHYWPLIQECNVPEDEWAKVCYLTIQEGLVQAGQTQRRAGLHIESPGTLTKAGDYEQRRYNWGCGAILQDDSRVEGGIYMASSVAKSCRIWNVQIRDPSLLAGKNGSLEHIRDVLGEGIFMEPEKIYWLTDATPHESLPLETETYRQFFRLVTSPLSIWYPEHSTANELVTIDTDVTSIVSGTKFEN